MAVESVEAVTIQISTDPWDQVDCDAFVCPTNSHGLMSHYPASKLRDLASGDVQNLVLEHTPLAVGSAFVTHAGRMRARYLIHVPNTDTPGGQVQVEDVFRASAAVLVACKLKGFTSVAVPLMGAFEGGIPAEEAARAIHSEFRTYRGDRPLRVLLMAKDADEIEVFELAIEGTG